MTHEEWMATRWRGKRLDTGEYAYGNLVVTRDAELGKDLNKRCILVDAGMVGEKDLTATWEVTPDSLERCTGMKCAIDGRLFYEGDRVRSAYLPEAVFTLRFGPTGSGVSWTGGGKWESVFMPRMRMGGSVPLRIFPNGRNE